MNLKMYGAGESAIESDSKGESEDESGMRAKCRVRSVKCPVSTSRIQRLMSCKGAHGAMRALKRVTRV